MVPRAPTHASLAIVRGALAFALLALLCSCARKAEPLVTPQRQAACADLQRLAQLHPAQAELERVEARLLALGADLPEPESAEGLPPLTAADLSPEDPPLSHPEDRSAEAAALVQTESGLRDIVDRSREPAPKPTSSRPAEAASEPPPRTAAEAESLSRAAEEAAREIADARATTLEIRGPGAEPAERWDRAAEAEAEAAAARLRSGWTPPSEAPTRAEEDVSGAPARREDSPGERAADSRARTRELEGELEREADAAARFFDGLEPTRPSAMPERPEPPDPDGPPEDAAPDLAAEAEALARRYAALRERILEDTRRTAISVGAGLGLDVNFSGQGPDRTAQLEAALTAFYHRNPLPTRGADAHETR